MSWERVSAVVVAGAVAIAITAGLVLGAGTTTVAVQPDSATVSAGETTTVDIVVKSADDGVGSINLKLAVADAQVANITDVSVAGKPSTVRTTGGDDSTRIAATGMDTVDTGSVTVATVTLEGEASGTTSLALSVAAVGNESGSSYDVSGTTNGELTVEGEATPTEDSDSDDDDYSSTGPDTPSETQTASPTPTPTPDPTPTPGTTPTVTETPTSTATSDEDSPQSPAPTVTDTVTTTGPSGTEPGSLQLLPLAVIGGVVLLVAGLIYYQRE